MAIPVRMPKLGMTMREGRVVEWRVEVGDAVEKGRVLLTIETEKAEIDVDATASGLLRHVYVERGETAACGALLAAITVDANEDFRADSFGELHGPAKGDAIARGDDDGTREAAAEGGLLVDAANGRSDALPRAEHGPSSPAARARARFPVSPAARALARLLGIDPGTVTGSGPGGRITRGDVESAAAAMATRPRGEGGVALEVTEDGDGPVVLLLPGFGTDASAFVAQSARLARRYRVRGLTPRGIGGSQAVGGGPISPLVVAADAAAILDGPAHVVGASFGAAAALELARTRPDLVRSLCLITPGLAPSPRLLAVLDAWTQLVAGAAPEVTAAAMLPWMFSGNFLGDPARAARAARGFAAMVRRTPAAVLRRYVDGLREWTPPCAADLARIEAPVLVIAAEDDLLTTGAAAVAEAIPGACLEVVEKAGHAVALEEPALVSRLLLEHLARCG